jgi:hypothetical protein
LLRLRLGLALRFRPGVKDEKYCGEADLASLDRARGGDCGVLADCESFIVLADVERCCMKGGGVLLLFFVGEEGVDTEVG